MPYCKVGDLNVHYLEQGTGETVVLVHGNTSSSVWWEYTLQRMAGDSYHFIAPDMRGRGDTEGSAAEWTVWMLSHDLSGLIEALNLGSVHLVGHSLGSNVAVQFALDHPNKVKSLTLLNPGWVAGDMPAEIADENRVKMMVENKELLKMALRGVAMKHPDDENWQRLVEASLKQHDEASLRGVRAVRDWVVVDKLGVLAHIPTLVVRGALDTYLSTEAVAMKIVENLPGAKYQVIENASHSPNVEAPDEWVALLRDHLRLATA